MGFNAIKLNFNFKIILYFYNNYYILKVLNYYKYRFNLYKIEVN